MGSKLQKYRGHLSYQAKNEVVRRTMLKREVISRTMGGEIGGLSRGAYTDLYIYLDILSNPPPPPGNFQKTL